MKILILILFLITSLSIAGGNTTNQSFSKSKKILLKQVYYDHPEIFYCGCSFTSDKKVIPSSRYTHKRNNKRSKRIEWEHVVPAHAFGQSFPEWRNGDQGCINKKGKPFKGCNCARKKAVPFRYMEADL